jgi:hypothetical protein
LASAINSPADFQGASFWTKMTQGSATMRAMGANSSRVNMPGLPVASAIAGRVEMPLSDTSSV